jgi:hypothetical protein
VVTLRGKSGNAELPKKQPSTLQTQGIQRLVENGISFISNISLIEALAAILPVATMPSRLKKKRTK